MNGSTDTALTIIQKHMISLACSITLSVLFLSLLGCGSGGAGEPAISTTATPTGATASLTWDTVQPPPGQSGILSYYIHYGRQSSGVVGSCSYEDVIRVSPSSGPTVSATVRGLDHDTFYYFVVSAYNGLVGPCSNEVSVQTPPAQT